MEGRLPGHSPGPGHSRAADRRHYRRFVERWRQVIGHDGYLRADLRLNTPVDGGRSRSVQSGYRAQWWHADGSEERWLGSGPLDLVDARSIKPGTTGSIKIYPMHPSSWLGVGVGAVLHLRERVGQTLGIAVVLDRVQRPRPGAGRGAPAAGRRAVAAELGAAGRSADALGQVEKCRQGARVGVVTAPPSETRCPLVVRLPGRPRRWRWASCAALASCP